VAGLPAPNHQRQSLPTHGAFIPSHDKLGLIGVIERLCFVVAQAIGRIVLRDENVEIQHVDIQSKLERSWVFPDSALH
jgi:hypothetical protein